MKKLLSIMGAALLMASCTEDYTDWATPFSNSAESAISVSLSVAPAATVDFASVTDENVQLFVPTISAPDGATATYKAAVANEDKTQAIELTVTGDGYVATSDLETAVNTLYGRRPVSRNVPVAVEGYIAVNGASFKNEAETTLTAIPNAPEIEDAYYVTGNVNGWDNTNTSLEVSNGGADPYENPVFTCMIPALADGGNIEFKLTPKSGIGGDWSKCITASDTEGKFATNNAGGNLVITAVEGAKFYRISFNMLDQTWSSEALNFGEFFYEIGNESGWGTPHALYGAKSDGKYKGYYYLNGEFKFKPNADNWDNDLEYVGEWKLADNGGPNCPDPGAGFYEINLDAGALTYGLTKIESVSMIGGFNDWSGDVDMTFNVEQNCWEVTTDAVSGEYKFRVNHDWGINFGGDPTGLTQDGANLNIEAGSHTFKLYLSYNGAHKLVIE